MPRTFAHGLVLLGLLFATQPQATIPDFHSEISTAHPGASIYSLPSGEGLPFTSALSAGGYSVDATITLGLYDSLGHPIAYYPWDDIWLESADGGLVPAPQGTTPDASTDIDGMTWWTNPIEAGGCTMGPIVTMIAGVAQDDLLDLRFNSADLNGDLILNLHDVFLFEEIRDDGYDDCADFNFDGVVDLLDFIYLQTAFVSSPTQPPGDPSSPLYEPCQYRLGVFFSSDYEFWDERRDAATNLDYTQFTPFDMHLVVIGCPEAVMGYEASLEVDPSFFALNTSFPASTLNLGDYLNHYVSFGIPQPPAGPAQAVLLSTVTFFPVEAEVSSQIRILPSSPSSLDGDGPALVIDHKLVRANFTPTSHSGCQFDLAPGDFPAAVATTYGGGVVTAVGDAQQPDIPAALAITAAAPNPFNPRTTHFFDLPRGGEVTLTVHDGRGRLVRTLDRGQREAGRHQVVWDGLDDQGGATPSGVYLVRLQAVDGARSSLKVTLVR